MSLARRRAGDPSTSRALRTRYAQGERVAGVKAALPSAEPCELRGSHAARAA
jgi:hypothetical protein